MKRKSKIEKLVDDRIDGAYRRTSCGVQVSVLSIPAIFREARAVLTVDMTDAALDQAMTGIVAKYRLN